MEDIISLNLKVAAEHIEGEGIDPASVMDLYTDDIVLAMPSRNLTIVGKAAIEANYHRMFGAMQLISMQPLDRFATETRVVDECLVRIRLVGEGFDNAPVPLGSTVDLRLLHVFEMRDGKIARETVFEGWKLAS